MHPFHTCAVSTTFSGRSLPSCKLAPVEPFALLAGLSCYVRSVLLMVAMFRGFSSLILNFYSFLVKLIF
jgi:hypothetical protein